jgi:hypothetical protein
LVTVPLHVAVRFDSPPASEGVQAAVAGWLAPANAGTASSTAAAARRTSGIAASTWAAGRGGREFFPCTLCILRVRAASPLPAHDKAPRIMLLDSLWASPSTSARGNLIRPCDGNSLLPSVPRLQLIRAPPKYRPGPGCGADKRRSGTGRTAAAAFVDGKTGAAAGKRKARQRGRREQIVGANRGAGDGCWWCYSSRPPHCLMSIARPPKPAP